MAEEIEIVKLPEQYHVWITALLVSYEQGIIHGLVTKGYVVSAADYTGVISYTFRDAASSVIAIKVEKNKIVPKDLMDDVKGVLTVLNANYHSIVISEYSPNCTWLGTNITVPPETKTETKEVNKKSN